MGGGPFLSSVRIYCTCRWFESTTPGFFGGRVGWQGRAEVLSAGQAPPLFIRSHLRRAFVPYLSYLGFLVQSRG